MPPGMSKAFTRETDGNDDDDDGDAVARRCPSAPRTTSRRRAISALRAELLQLIDEERPKVVEVVHWAACNGDRSENGDYIYGKKRLREIDRRIRFLTKRLDIAEVTDPSAHHGTDQVFFGATVTYANERGDERTVTIMGIDEADSLARPGELDFADRAGAAEGARGRRGQAGHAGGREKIEVLEVRYPEPQ